MTAGIPSTLISETEDLKIVTINLVEVDKETGKKAVLRKVRPSPYADILVRVAVPHEGKTYNLGLNEASEQSTFDQILSTFKFTDEASSWKTYTNDNISFQYPLSWKQHLLQLRGSGSTVEIIDPGGQYFLTFRTQGNYNQLTGKAFSSLEEFEGLGYKAKTVTIDGRGGIQVLPRAGGENKNAIDFFSRDAKFIYTLYLETQSSDEAKIQEGQTLFDQILSTFKFLN